MMKPTHPFHAHPATLMRVALGVSALALLAGIFAHAYAGGFSRYVADDFCTAGKLNQVGFWNAQLFWYQHWTGRFAFTFLVTLLHTLGTQIAPYLPGLALLWLMVTGVHFTHSLFEKLKIHAPVILPVFLALLVIFLLLTTTPNVGQNLYWMTGVVTYLIPVVVLLTLLSVLMNNSEGLSEQPTGSKFAVGALVMLLAWANSGFSEIMTVVQLFILFLVNVYFRFMHPARKINTLWILALVGCVAGTVMMLAAPGNAIRRSAFESPENAFILAANTLRYSATYMAVWLLKHAGLLFPTGVVLILFTSLARQFLAIPEDEIFPEAKSWKTLIMVGAGMIFIVVMTFLPSVWVTLSGPEDRAKFLATLLLSVLFVCACVVVGVWLRDAIAIREHHQRFVTSLLLVMLAYFLAAVPIQEAREVISSGAERANFAEQWDERDTSIRDQISAGQARIVGPALQDNPFGLETISDEPSHWLNVCVAEFYGVEQMRVK